MASSRGPALVHVAAQHGVRRVALQAHVAEALEHAAACIASDPDAAALLLEGIYERIIAAWYARRGVPAPPRQQLLRDVEAVAPGAAMHLRLALRAPDVHARLVQASRLASLLLDRCPESIQAPCHVS